MTNAKKSRDRSEMSFFEINTPDIPIVLENQEHLFI